GYLYGRRSHRACQQREGRYQDQLQRGIQNHSCCKTCSVINRNYIAAKPQKGHPAGFCGVFLMERKAMNQFRKVIRNWEDWEATAGEISAFSGVVEKIFHNEGLPAADIRKLPPSTNAVFRVGDYVIKIYAPRQAQM